jgi:uncharacterized protein (TIGR03905 family)
MAVYSYKTSGVCSSEIQFELTDGKVRNVRFIGGCPGNLQAISKLVEGAEASKVADLLAGNDCGGKGTSCADQLSLALKAALNAAK